MGRLQLILPQVPKRVIACVLSLLLAVMAFEPVALAQDGQDPSALSAGVVSEEGEGEPGQEGDEPEGEEDAPIPSRSDLGEGSYYIQSKFVTTCVLDVKGSGVLLATTAGAKSQQWVLRVGKDGYATLVNRFSKKALTVQAAPANGVKVTQAALKPSSDVKAEDLAQENLDQKWVVKRIGKGCYQIQSALDSRFVVRIAGKSLKGGYGAELRAAGKETRQQFSFVPIAPTAAKKGKRTVKNGVYMLAPTAKATQVVGIAGKSKKTGANARIESFAANTSQAFRVVYDNHGFYTLTNVRSGKKLAPVASCSVSDINVGQYVLKSASVQDRAKWRIDKYGAGYRLVNKATGLALSMADPKHRNNSNVRASTPGKSAAQKFSLVRPCAKSPAPSKVKGLFYIAMASNRKSIVGTRDDSRKEWASVNVRGRRNTNLQRFRIKGAGNGTYYLQNVMTKRVVALKDRSKQKDVNVVMRWQSDDPCRKWRIVYNDDFSYAFANAYSGMHLHVAGARADENTNIKAYSALTGSPAQKFCLLKTQARTNEKVELDVPCFWQNPELPTGCESVALTNALRYWGFRPWKTEMADRWMPYGDDGVYNFIGNPRNWSGWIICAPGIANTANAYLWSRGSDMWAVAIKGRSLRSLREYLDRGEPLVVWTTIGMCQPGSVLWWNSGYPLRTNNHAVVLCGYDPNTGDYKVADSLAGVVWRNGGSFEWLYNEMGRQAVLIAR